MSNEDFTRARSNSIIMGSHFEPQTPVRTDRAEANDGTGTGRAKPKATPPSEAERLRKALGEDFGKSLCNSVSSGTSTA